MRKIKCVSALLAAFLSLGMLADAEAVGVLRPNIKKPASVQTEIQARPISKTPAVEKQVVSETKPQATVKQSSNSVEQIKARFNQTRREVTDAEREAVISKKESISATEPKVKKQVVVKQTALAETPESKQLDVELAGMLGDKGAQVPGIGVIAYKNGNKIYENGLGRRYIWGDKTGDLPFTTNSLFRTATVSQQIVALAALQLAGKSILNLDEDISKYLDFTLRNPNNPDIKITARMLMSHTSGLRDARYQFDQSWKDIFANGKGFFAKKDEKPGEYFHYANINYRILATILEKVSNTRFDLFMKNGILKDLNIKGGYNIADIKPKEQKLLGGIYQKQANDSWNENGAWVLQMDDFAVLKGHKNFEFPLQPVEPGKDMWINLANYQIGKNASMFVPECGLRASLDDLSHVLEMIFAQGSYMNKQVIDNKLLDEMFKIHWVYDDWDKNGETYGGIFEAYGYGVMPYMNGSTTRLSTVKAHQWWGQIGDNYGVVSGLVIDRRTKSGYVYLANGQAMNWSDARSRGKFSKHIVWQENINDAICRNLFKD